MQFHDKTKNIDDIFSDGTTTLTWNLVVGEDAFWRYELENGPNREPFIAIPTGRFTPKHSIIYSYSTEFSVLNIETSSHKFALVREAIEKGKSSHDE